MDDMIEAMKLTLAASNNTIHTNHEERALKKHFELDAEISDILNLPGKNCENIFRLVRENMTRKKELHMSSAIRLWTRSLAVTSLFPVSGFESCFSKVDLTDEVVKLCIKKVVLEYSLEIYNLWYQFAANHNFKTLHMGNMHLAEVECVDNKKTIHGHYPCHVPLWKKIIQSKAFKVQEKMVQSLQQLGNDMSKRKREEIIVDAHYIELFSPQTVQNAEKKIAQDMCVKYSQMEVNMKKIDGMGKRRKIMTTCIAWKNSLD
jgi:hypothetical protein